MFWEDYGQWRVWLLYDSRPIAFYSEVYEQIITDVLIVKLTLQHLQHSLLFCRNPKTTTVTTIRLPSSTPIVSLACYRHREISLGLSLSTKRSSDILYLLPHGPQKRRLIHKSSRSLWGRKSAPPASVQHISLRLFKS